MVELQAAMAERLSFRTKLIGTAVIGLAAIGCREKDTEVVGPQPSVAPTVAGRFVTPAETQAPTVVTTPVPERTAVGVQPTTQATQRPTEVPAAASNSAVRFGEGLRNWVEVQDSESLRALSEFTILARVKLDGIPPDAVVSKGDKVEAYALFTSIFSCLDGGMSLVIDDKNYCGGLRVERNKFVNIGVSFKDGKAKFIADQAESNEIIVDRKIPSENGFLAIGASPRGLSNEGMSGQIDSLAIIGKGQSVQEMRESLALLEKQDVAGFRSKNSDTRGLWLFNGDYKDGSGKGNDGKTFGAVSLVSVN